MKTSRPPLIKAVACELDLKLHQLDTFRNWSPDTDSHNLVVTASFGLLVPKRILDGAKYGGLNVHPSLLPDLRGSAPIIHALLKRRAFTGVSLQTMHPTKFDHGTVLKQTDEMPIPQDSTHEDMLHVLGPLGAEILRKGIEEALFVPPVQDVREGMTAPAQRDLAPKITSRDRQIDWNSWTADDVVLRDRALGDLWDTQTFARCQAQKHVAVASKRIIFHGPWTKVEGGMHSSIPGHPQLVLGPFRKGLTLGIKAVDDCAVVPHSATIEGKTKGMGLQALQQQLRGRKG